MKIIFVDQAWDDYLYWQATDQSILRKINSLVKAIERIPFEDSGKSEPLKHNMAGLWSRRINLEHRLVYKIDSGSIHIHQCRYHY